VPNRLLSAADVTLPDGNCYVLVPGSAPSCTSSTFNTTAPIQSVKTQGVEYQWRWQPFEATRLLLSQAFIHISSEFLPGVKYNERWEQLTNQSAPTHTTSALLMQKLPFGVDLSLAGYWVGNHRWSQNTAVPGYQRVDARLGYPFKWGGQRGEIAYTVQSLDGDHIEYKGPKDNVDIDSRLASRIVERRQWISLRLDF
jgi:iron complex outermembrane receptor protein